MTVSSLLAACKNTTPTPANQPVATQLAFDTIKVSKVYKGKTEDTNTTVDIIMLKAKGNDQDATNINSFFEDYWASSLSSSINGGEDKPKDKDLNKLADAFIAGYKLDLEANPDMFGYTYDGNMSVHYYGPSYITFENTCGTYLGGAHGYGSTEFNIYDLGQHKFVGYTDVFTDTLKMKPIVEKAFRKNRGIDEKTPIQESDYFWGNAFALPHTFGIEKDSIVFFYIPYEAASYAEGDIAVRCAKAELKDFLKPNY